MKLAPEIGGYHFSVYKFCDIINLLKGSDVNWLQVPVVVVIYSGTGTSCSSDVWWNRYQL